MYVVLSICLLTVISLITITYPRNECYVYISCGTGLGDLIFETISAVSLLTASGCLHSHVIANYNREHGFYNLTRILSPHFTYTSGENYSWRTLPEYILPTSNKVFIPQCGIKDAAWISSVHGSLGKVINTIMRNISSNIYIDSCNAKWSNITVHARRGDKITSQWSAISSLEYNYAYFTSWLRRNNIRHISLISDDPIWAQQYKRTLHKLGVGVTYNKYNSALDDMCIMSRSSHVIRLGTTSTFSSMGSILARVNLSVISPNVSDALSIQNYIRARDMDMHWVSSGILNVSLL